MTGDLETEDTHKMQKAHTKESLTRMPSGSFGLLSDDETEDEKMRQGRKKEIGAKTPAIIVSHSIISTKYSLIVPGFTRLTVLIILLTGRGPGT